LAANVEAANRRDVALGPGVAREARRFGLEGLADQLESAIVEGVVDSVSELTRKIRQEIAARIQERSIYDDFER
jgi:hypothetical protein